MSSQDSSLTTLEAAQANTLAAVQLQVANLNTDLRSNYLAVFGSWAQSVLAGRSDNSTPPQPPKAFVVGYFTDPTTGGGTLTPGPYANTPVQWPYPAVGTQPVCDLPPIPSAPKPPVPVPERDDIRNVPVGDTLPVGFKTTAPDGGVWQKQASPTPFGVAYYYVRVG